MKKFLKVYMFATVMLGNALLFAQGPGTDVEDEFGNTDGSVEGAPINGWMVYMMILGICFAFYYFKNRKVQVN